MIYVLRLQTVAVIRATVGMATDDQDFAAELARIFPAFASPETYATAFPGPLETVGEAEPGDDDAKADADDTPLACPAKQMRDTLSPLAARLFDLLQGVYTGGYDRAFKELAGETGNNQATLSGQLLAEDVSGPGNALKKNFSDLLKRLDESKKAVHVQEEAAPAPSLRVLGRMASDPDAAKGPAMQERAEVWKQAQAKRKEVAAVAVAKNKDTMTRVVGKAFEGWKPDTAHWSSAQTSLSRTRTGRGPS